MNRKIVAIMLKKDFRHLLSSRKTWLPMLLTTTLVCIVIPILIAFLGTYSTDVLEEDQEITRLIDTVIAHMPEGEAKAQILELKNLNQQFSYFFLNYMAISMFIMVSVINSMVTAASSFVGEKERGTLETLLFSPISIKELFVSKIIASFIPSVFLTYTAFFITFSAINFMLYPKYGYLFMFNSLWAVLLGWVIPVILLFTILLNVIISSKTKTFQEAQQIGGLLVLPVIGFTVSQSIGLVFISTSLLLVAGVVLLFVSLLLLFIIIKRTNRNVLFESQI